MTDGFLRPSVLNEDHKLNEFDCGEPSLNQWLIGRARYNQSEDYSQTFVIADTNQNVVAYACLAAGMIERDVVPRNLRTGQAPKIIPVAILGRLAVSSNYQGFRLGERMLQHVISVVLSTGLSVSFRAILVDALNENARNFYLKYGFEPTKISQDRLLLSLTKIKASL
jgi:GNAT superfamily N-acetyltransferase